MTKKKPPATVKRIKTGGLERRLSIASAGVVVGTRAVTHLWANALRPKDKRQKRRKKMIADQAQYLVDELGKLKGSVVKIGQVMALYGEHVLPEEVTTAFRTLEEQTTAVEWPVIEKVLQKELGEELLSELIVDEAPIGAASLGQVHRAVRKSDGFELCLKVQYPGVADAIDSDLNDVALILRWTKMVIRGKDFDDWLDEVREMLHREVDYQLEAETTSRFRVLLKDDKRFVVPEVLPRYCTVRVLAASYEEGFVVNGDDVAAMPRESRNLLGKAFLELFFREVYEWSELQTDPNFGNYRIRPKQSADDIDRIVLLDFGAVKKYDDDFIGPVKAMVMGAYLHDRPMVKQGALDLRIMQADYPDEAQNSFAELCMMLIEPLNYDCATIPANALNAENGYRWNHSNLPKRVGKQAAKSAFSRHFSMPPKEFTFLSRKLLGVYSFIAALDAEFDGRDVIALYRQ